MLRVLKLKGVPISNLPNEISALFNLHYFGLRGTKAKQLPNNIQKLQSLQTLDLHRSRIKKLPHDVTQLKQLRHLIVSGSEVEFRGTVIGCVPTLEEAWQWKNLQTLKFVKANKKLVQRLGDMKERELTLVELWQSQLIEDPLPSLGKLPKLVELRLKADAFDRQKLHLRTGWFLNLKSLHSIRLKNLNSIVIEEGAMISLHELSMAGLQELKMVPRGIEFLTSHPSPKSRSTLHA